MNHASEAPPPAYVLKVCRCDKCGKLLARRRLGWSCDGWGHGGIVGKPELKRRIIEAITKRRKSEPSKSEVNAIIRSLPDERFATETTHANDS